MNAEELDSFLKSVLKLKGNWSQTKDPLNHKLFKTECAAISWWKSTKTLSVSGKCEDDIRQQLKSLSSNAKSQKSSTENTGPHTHQKITDDHSSSPNSHIQQEFKNVWSAIHSVFTNNVQTGSDIVSLVRGILSCQLRVASCQLISVSCQLVSVSCYFANDKYFIYW